MDGAHARRLKDDLFGVVRFSPSVHELQRQQLYQNTNSQRHDQRSVTHTIPPLHTGVHSEGSMRESEFRRLRIERPASLLPQ